MTSWSPERLRRWTAERQAGMQQVNDWRYWNVPAKPIDWLEECGCPQCKRCTPCIWARVSMDIHKIEWAPSRKMFEAPHYIVSGCNIHDKSEWVRYVMELPARQQQETPWPKGITCRTLTDPVK
jgi:hypothetical protein